MTSLVLSLALVLTPAPIHPRQEVAPWPIATTPKSVASIVDLVPSTVSFTESWISTDREWDTASFALTVEPAPPEPPIPPPVQLTPIEAGMNRLAELGASPYELRVFGCLAWNESRNDPYAVSATNDKGLFQISTYWHRWRWAGRDIFDPIVNAEVAWSIYQESGFKAWTTHRLCGV